MSKNLLFFIFIGVFHTVFSQDIDHLPAVWLKADSADREQGYWRDISGNDRHAIPAQGILPENFSLMNFNKSLPLDEINYLTIPDFTVNKNRITTIIVYEVEDSLQEKSLWALQPASGKRVGLTTRRILGEREAITYTEENRLNPVINSLSQSWYTPGNHDTVSDFFLGYVDSLGFNGKISECIVFEGNVPDSVLLKYISYLAVKYGVTLYQTDYRNSKGTITWNYTGYPVYSGSVAGIGKDSCFGLNQKQSCLLEQKIKVGLEQLQVMNEQNTAFLPENHFLIWGFDSNALEKYGEIYSDEGEELSLYGNSLLQATGSESSTLRTFLQVDGSNWENDAEDYVLLIDRTGTGDFSTINTEVYFPFRTDSSSILFSDIYWDTDLNGTDRFCFAYMPLPEQAKTTAKGETPVLKDIFSKMKSSGISKNQNSRVHKAGNLNVTEKENQYLLYPNPNSGRFRLDIHYAVASDVVVRILNPEGKLIRTMNGSPAQDHRFEGTVPVKGNYMIGIQGEQENKTFKMIVQ